MFQGASLTDGDGQGNFDQLPQQSLDDMLQGKTTANISFYDDTALCTAAYRIMKSMLNSWLGEVVSYENPLAAEQIEHFHRWATFSYKLTTRYNPHVASIAEQGNVSGHMTFRNPTCEPRHLNQKCGKPITAVWWLEITQGVNFSAWNDYVVLTAEWNFSLSASQSSFLLWLKGEHRDPIERVIVVPVSSNELLE